jgi:trimeric autotransporter adhesin
MAIDAAGTLYFDDFGYKNGVTPEIRYSHIRKIQNGIISTVTNTASLITVDPTGNLYTANVSPAGTFYVQKIANGVAVTIAGTTDYTPGQSFGENGPALDAILGELTGVSVDRTGNIFITSSGQSTVIPPSFDVVRKISNGMITTVAGGALGSMASIGDNGPPVGAQLYFFQGANNYVTSGNVAMDAAGNVYIVEFNRIRKISQGVITTVAGTGLAGFGGDGGPATEALLNDPWGIGLDAAGNLYIADQGNLRVREVSNGIINTIAGNGTLGFSGDGGPAVSAMMGGRRPGGQSQRRRLCERPV